MAKTIHMFELTIEIEPFRPRVKRWASLMSDIVVSAASVAFRARIATAFTELLENLSRPPVEMRIDDAHDVSLSMRSAARAWPCFAASSSPRLDNLSEIEFESWQEGITAHRMTQQLRRPCRWAIYRLKI